MKKLLLLFSILLASLTSFSQTITANNTGTSVRITYLGAGLSTSIVTVSDFIAEYTADGVDHLKEAQSDPTLNFWSTASGTCEFYGRAASQLVGGKIQYWAVVGVYNIVGNEFIIPYNVQPSYGVGIFSDGKTHQLKVQWYSPQLSPYAPTYNGISVTTEAMPFTLPAATCAPAFVAAKEAAKEAATLDAARRTKSGRIK